MYLGLMSSLKPYGCVIHTYFSMLPLKKSLLISISFMFQPLDTTMLRTVMKVCGFTTRLKVSEKSISEV